MKPVDEWDEGFILSLPYGEFDWLEVKGRRAIDLTLPTVKEGDVLENLAKEISAFANSGGGQLVLGLANPTNKTNKWQVDDGGVSTSVKGKINTREWLEDIIPNLVEYPLAEFNVYAITPRDSESQVSPGNALYIIDIGDSTSAPHQSRFDNKYYARVGGKSRPISHRMVVDILGRRQYPRIELEFEIERMFIKGEPRQTGMGMSAMYLIGSAPSEKDINTYKLIIRARNNGKVYAQYVNAFIYIPIQLLSSQEVKVWGHGLVEKIDGQDYLRYYKENTHRDAIGSRGLQTEYGPSRFDPILPGLSHVWEIALKNNLNDIEREDLFIKWTVYADNAAPVDGEAHLSAIKVTESIEPNFDALHDEDE